jgi:hypothetical protein
MGIQIETESDQTKPKRKDRKSEKEVEWASKHEKKP